MGTVQNTVRQPIPVLLPTLDGVFGGRTMVTEGPRFRIVVGELQLWRRREFWCESSGLNSLFSRGVHHENGCNSGSYRSANEEARPGTLGLDRGRSARLFVVQTHHQPHHQNVRLKIWPRPCLLCVELPVLSVSSFYTEFNIRNPQATTPIAKHDLPALELSLSQLLDVLERTLEGFVGGDRYSVVLPFQYRLRTSHHG